MKRRMQVLVMLLFCASAVAQTFPVVVPGGLANTEGNSSMTEPFNSPSFRMQMVFDASQFAFLGGGTGRIDRIDFRVDGTSTGGAVYSFPGSTIQLSTIQRTPDSLSPVFTENIGSDVATVWNGGVAFGNIFFAGENPQRFTETIYSTFLYSPSMGNLLLDIRARSGQVVFPGGLDAQGVVGDGVSRVFANSELLSAGTVDTLGLVTRFSITIVPEPSVSMLAICGVVFISIFRLRKHL